MKTFYSKIRKNNYFSISYRIRREHKNPLVLFIHTLSVIVLVA